MLSFGWILRYLYFISSDSPQSMVCAFGRGHNGLKVLFCFLHATPSHYHHHSDLLTCIEHIRRKIPGAFVNSCWVYSVGSMS